jgi:hypothetical protein
MGSAYKSLNRGKGVFFLECSSVFAPCNTKAHKKSQYLALFPFCIHWSERGEKIQIVRREKPQIYFFITSV